MKHWSWQSILQRQSTISWVGKTLNGINPQKRIHTFKDTVQIYISQISIHVIELWSIGILPFVINFLPDYFDLFILSRKRDRLNTSLAEASPSEGGWIQQQIAEINLISMVIMKKTEFDIGHVMFKLNGDGH